MKLIALAASVIVLIACGGNSGAPDGGSGGGGGGGGNVGGNGGVPSADLATASAADLGKPGGLTISVAVPSTWKGTPRQLVVAAFDAFPVTGPPAAVLYQATPAIAAGQTLSLSGDAGSLSGAKQVIAVLYMQGGGMFAPMPNLDWVSQPAAVPFGSGSVDIGPLTLMLDSADGGF